MTPRKVQDEGGEGCVPRRVQDEGGGHDPRSLPAEGRQPPVWGLRPMEMRAGPRPSSSGTLAVLTGVGETQPKSGAGGGGGLA